MLGDCHTIATPWPCKCHNGTQSVSQPVANNRLDDHHRQLACHSIIECTLKRRRRQQWKGEGDKEELKTIELAIMDPPFY